MSAYLDPKISFNDFWNKCSSYAQQLSEVERVRKKRQFLASQHPSASQASKRVASKYAMPARMWRHGIHSFLELLRHRLPGSLEHMLTFIYLAYSMMALLYETVPAFEDTWIEWLGDLGRYRYCLQNHFFSLLLLSRGRVRDWKDCSHNLMSPRTES
ncbi:hypothetical protein F5Y08DRAFT_94256 [Xylaria arbuscula]|nr:hypothetical protein F5Y08DRAFT_94256 [Xylaria arbuscula]